MRNKLPVAIPILLILLISVYLYFRYVPKSPDLSNTNGVTTVNTNAPYIDAVKFIFLEYGRGNTKHISSTAVEGLGNKNSGMQSLSREYFTNNFEILNIRDGIAGGKEMNIVFENRPKEIYWVWIYKLADETYQIKGFQLNTLTEKK